MKTSITFAKNSLKLQKHFKKFGDNWTLLQEGRKCALYKRLGKNGLHYEVVGLEVVTEKIDTGNFVITPGKYLKLANSAYGVCSFCFTGNDLEKAKSKFSQQENKY